MSIPKVSVIIPVYNVKEYLEQCLDSLVNQSLKDIEIICVDDESSDGSREILNKYAEKDSRVKIIRQKNGGAGKARNTGMQYAKGEYLSILDSDDFFETDMLEIAYKNAVKDDVDIITFASDFFSEKSKKFVPNHFTINEDLLPSHSPFSGVDVEKNIFRVFVGWSWDKLFKNTFVKENNLKFQVQRTTNDMLFVYSAVVKATKIKVIDDVLAHHRLTEGTLSVTREKSWHCFHDALKALKKQLADWNLYERFKQDYINYFVHFSLWHLRTLRQPTHDMLYNKLRDEWFNEEGIQTFPENYFYNKKEYNEYKDIMSYKADEKRSFADKVRLIFYKIKDLSSRVFYVIRKKGIFHTVKWVFLMIGR